jgi:hypothetical protein
MRILTLLLVASLTAGSAAADWGWHWGQSDREQGKESRGLSGLHFSNLNSGVCDPLENATRGLEFLCIAFCELQDCQPDYTLDNPFQNCSMSSRWILSRYEARRGAGDPDMPCLQQPETSPECPCWTRNELAGLRQNDVAGETAACYQNVTSTGLTNYDGWQISNPPGQTMHYLTTIASIENSESDGSAVCSLVDTCDDGNCMGASRYVGITAEQFAACEQDVYQSAVDRGLNCMDLSQ